MFSQTFNLQRQPTRLPSFSLPTDLTVHSALERVLRLPSVGSKRYLTNKVDRCVTGLIAQQQCVGPLHTPLADVAVAAVSHFTTVKKYMRTESCTIQQFSSSFFIYLYFAT